MTHTDEVVEKNTNKELVDDFEDAWGDCFDDYICCAGHDCNCGGKETTVAVRSHLYQIIEAAQSAKVEEVIGKIDEYVDKEVEDGHFRREWLKIHFRKFLSATPDEVTSDKK